MENSPQRIISHTESSNATDAACLDTVEDMDTSGPEPLTLPADVCKVSILWINGSTNSVTLRFLGEDFSDQLFQFEELLQNYISKSSHIRDFTGGAASILIGAASFLLSVGCV